MRRLVLRAVPYALRRRFDPQAAGDLSTTFELRVRDRDAGEPVRFAIEVGGRQCRVRRGGAGDASAGVTVHADDLVRMASGVRGWSELLSSGRLELTGNPFVALRFPVVFRLAPTARRPARTTSSVQSPQM